MMRVATAVLCALLAALALSSAGCQHDAPDPAADLAAAKAVFMRNIEAIQAKDREAYLACYRDDERLVRAGATGIKMGYAELAEGTAPTGSERWPSKLVADDVEVRWIQPGVVYGSYRYTVVIDGVETTGVSERVFVESEGSWRIAVTTAFEAAKP